MTPLTGKIIKEYLEWRPRIGSVLPVNLPDFPGCLTSTDLRVIADKMDEYDGKNLPRKMVRCDSMEELMELADKIPEDHPLNKK